MDFILGLLFNKFYKNGLGNHNLTENLNYFGINLNLVNSYEINNQICYKSINNLNSVLILIMNNHHHDFENQNVDTTNLPNVSINKNEILKTIQINLNKQKIKSFTRELKRGDDRGRI